jgi:hypothetical protein
MCALGKGFIKNVRLAPLNEGVTRRKEISENIFNKGDFLPNGITIGDMDDAFENFIRDELELTIKGKKVPVILLTIQRWSEFSKTWEFTDNFKDLKLPFISIVRKPDIQEGTNQIGLWNIPGHRNYTYIKVPINEGGRTGIDLYKIPQPTCVDINYEVRLFCNRLEEINTFSSKMSTIYNARQAYINVNGHPMPTIRESVSDESPYDLEGKRFYINLNEITLQGYILNENEFEVIPTISRGVVFSEISKKSFKPKYVVSKTNENFIYDFIFSCSEFTSTNFTITNEKRIVNIDNLVNCSNPTFTINGNPISLPFNVSIGDNINIRIDRNIYQDSSFKLIGELNE